MDNFNCQEGQEGNRSPLSEQGKYRASGLLFTNVMQRIEPLRSYLVAEKQSEEILAGLQNERWEVRVVALYALKDVGTVIPLPPLLAALQDEHAMVRMAAVHALGYLGSHIPLPQLEQALQDSDWEVRERAVFVASSLPATMARPLLTRALQDTQLAIREVAMEVLSRLDKMETVSLVKPAGETVARQLTCLSLQNCLHYLTQEWSLMMQQIFILRTYWFSCLGMLLTGYLLVLVMTLGPLHINLYAISLVLTLVTTISAAVAAAFTSNLRKDPGIEIMLSTVVSLRKIIYYRYLLAISTHIILSGLVSVLLALCYGQNWWGIVQIWLGPLFLISSLTAALVLVLGSWLSISLTIFFELFQTLNLGSEGKIMIFHSQLWQTNPVILGLAILCFALTLFCAPNHIQGNKAIKF